MFIAVKAIISLLLMIGVLYGILKLLQKYTKVGNNMSNANGMKIDGLVYLDDQCKIVNFTHGSVGYLILVSKSGSLLLDKYEKQ